MLFHNENGRCSAWISLCAPLSRPLLLAAVSWTTLSGAALAQTTPSSNLQDEPAQLDEVIVTGVPYGISQNATTIATTVLNEEQLAVAPAASLGDLLNGTPDVRGMSGPRVQVLTNGVGLIDASSVSPDHQVASDPAEANRIEIVRGPATLTYGGSAIGGVVNILDGRIPEAMPEGGAEFPAKLNHLLNTTMQAMVVEESVFIKLEQQRFDVRSGYTFDQAPSAKSAPTTARPTTHILSSKTSASPARSSLQTATKPGPT